MNQQSDQADQVPTLEPPSTPETGGLQLLLTDAWTTLILLNLVRRRAIVRVLGVSPGDADAITVIGVVLIAESVHRACGRLVQGASPTRADAVLCAGTARAFLGTVVGPAVDEMPGLGALVAFALVTHAARPALTRSVGALRAASHRWAQEFHQRYGSPARASS